MLISHLNAVLSTSGSIASHTRSIASHTRSTTRLTGGSSLFDVHSPAVSSSKIGKIDTHNGCFAIYGAVRFSSSSSPLSWMFPRFQYTKYRISKPWTTNTHFDDINLSDPSRSDFAKFTKETPLFLRFLKLVTEFEGRPKDFFEFTKRCADGLVVEKDVYLTKAELKDVMWRNGYNETEINALELAFPSNYQFHYPELAAIFDLQEDDCYKYCIRQRAAKPMDLVELNYKPPTNTLSTYGLCFLGVWLGLANHSVGNIWFYAKTFPFGMVFYFLARHFYRDIREYLWKEDNAMAESAQENKEKGEEAIYSQMKKYAGDSLCVEFLKDFKPGTQTQLANYRAAFVRMHMSLMSNLLLQKLQSIRKSEEQIRNSLQQAIVSEIFDSFKSTYNQSKKLQDDAFAASLQMLSGEQNVSSPIEKHVARSLKELQTADLEHTKGNKNGTIVERVAAVFQEKESDFLSAFTVSAQEAEEVKQLAAKCKSGVSYDFSKLSPVESARLENLYSMINRRVGFYIPEESSLESVSQSDESSADYAKFVNETLEAAKTNIRNARLSAFAHAFS